MTSFELITTLVTGSIPVDHCGTSVFHTSDLSELSNLFGKNYTWSGHMFSGHVFYAYRTESDDWIMDDADLVGINLDDANEQIFVLKLGD